VSITAVGVLGGSLVAGCGGDAEPTHQLVGFRPSGEQLVGDVVLPDVLADGAPFAFAAPDDGLLVAYFGYTSCPDVCPTSLTAYRSAVRELGDDGSRISLAMTTIDPQRDTPRVLGAYVQSFTDQGHALRTTDDDLLAEAAEAFGVNYSVEIQPDGTVDVAHSGTMYVVDDTGRVVLAWPFGVTDDDMAGDLELLLDETEGAPA
jgi:protein SCO1/2